MTHRGPTSLLMLHHRPRRGREAGFTIIEVMVAMFVTLVGVLGTLVLIDTAMGVGKTSRSREAATNLAREVVEAARERDYDVLLTSTAPAALQAGDGLEDADPSAAGWQLERRSVRYTVAVDACIYDDPKDGSFSGNAGAGYCPGLPAGGTDSNGDDYRKLTVTVAWDAHEVRLVANIVNPAGGFGPRVTVVSSSPAPDTNSVVPVTGTTTSVDMTVETTTATALNWDAGDAKSGGQLTDAAGVKSWQFGWQLGTPIAPTSYTCATPVDWVPDAPAYQMTFQPFDSSGTPGDLRTQTIGIDRSMPYRLCDFAGGRNPQHGGVVDLQWRASFEGDVVSYSVWRRKQGAEPSDKLVCAAVRASECTDVNPPTAGDAISYYVRPQQDNIALAQAFGPPTELTIGAVTTANAVPTAPSNVSVTPGAQPTISWTASTDTGGAVILYRIYRDGQTIAQRYGKTSNEETLSFTDKNAGGTAHTYYVSAVDDAFAESPLAMGS